MKSLSSSAFLIHNFLFGTCMVGTSSIESRKIGSLSHRFLIFCLTVLDEQLIISNFSLTCPHERVHFLS